MTTGFWSIGDKVIVGEGPHRYPALIAEPRYPSNDTFGKVWVRRADQAGRVAIALEPDTVRRPTADELWFYDWTHT